MVVVADTVIRERTPIKGTTGKRIVSFVSSNDPIASRAFTVNKVAARRKIILGREQVT